MIRRDAGVGWIPRMRMRSHSSQAPLDLSETLRGPDIWSGRWRHSVSSCSSSSHSLPRRFDYASPEHTRRHVISLRPGRPHAVLFWRSAFENFTPIQSFEYRKKLNIWITFRNVHTIILFITPLFAILINPAVFINLTLINLTFFG